MSHFLGEFHPNTTVNYALSFDPIPVVWQNWRTRFDVQGFSFGAEASDYGIEGLNLLSALRDVRTRSNVHEPTDERVNDNNRLFFEGCRRLGVSARKFEPNMRGCIGCGFCGQGCAYDAKRGTLVTYVQDALRHGVKLIHHCTIDEIVFEKTAGVARAVGVKATVLPTRPGSRCNTVTPGPVSISARLVVVSAGAIESPALLMRSHAPDLGNRIGRGLVLHPSLPIAGLFNRKVSNYRGITGSYYSDHFYADHGFMFERLFDQPIDAAFALPGFGVAHFNLMRKYDQLAGFGTMLVDVSSHDNRVMWNQDTGASIRYRLSNFDKERLRFAAARMVEVMLAAGAERAILTSHEPLTPRGDATFIHAAEAKYCENLTFAPNATLISSAHAQASVKMSEDPRLGSINSRGELHGAKNLLVCDSSAFPTSCGQSDDRHHDDGTLSRTPDRRGMETV
ncbi:MAG: GMC family oxidoreductase N-terminal domain-containing protein [Vulcanimicrobiaceae bacterium]